MLTRVQEHYITVVWQFLKRQGVCGKSLALLRHTFPPRDRLRTPASLHLSYNLPFPASLGAYAELLFLTVAYRELDSEICIRSKTKDTSSKSLITHVHRRQLEEMATFPLLTKVGDPRDNMRKLMLS